MISLFCRVSNAFAKFGLIYFLNKVQDKDVSILASISPYLPFLKLYMVKAL